MAEELTTNERRCPKCGSEDVRYQGVGHTVGIGEKKPKVFKYQYSCLKCKALFWYKGESP